jgi:hypothetical protein
MAGNSMNFPATTWSFIAILMIKNSALLPVALVVCAAFGGCRSIPLDTTGQMVAVYQFGEFRMLVNTTAPVAAQAVQKAVKQLDLYQTSAVVNKFNAEVVARARNDQRVTIKIEEVNSLQTMVRIRWGEGGDMAKSRKLYDAIESNLQ